GIISFFLFYFTIFVWSIAFGIAVLIFQYVPALMAIVSIILTAGILGGGIFIFFWIASRFAYVQQAIMVEGLGVFAAISRSTSLASKNAKRFAALFIFTTVAAYSALALLYVPLGWYAWIEGVSLISDAD